MDEFYWFNSTILLLAIIVNIFALLCVARGHFQIESYRRFLLSLLSSNLYLAVVNGALFIMQAVYFYDAQLNPLSSCLVEVTRRLGWTGFIINLFNLLGMGIDHWLAIVHPMKYRYILDKPIAKFILAGMWIFAFMLVFADYPVRAIFFPPTKSETAKCLNVDDGSSAQNVSSIKISFAKTSSKKSSKSGDRSKNSYELSLAELDDLFRQNENLTANLAGPCNTDNADALAMLGELSSSIHDLVPGDDYSSGRGLNGGSNSANVLLCGYLDSMYTFYLDCSVMALALVGLIILSSFSGRIFKWAADKTAEQHSKLHLKQLVITTLMLLGTFSLCWIPYVSWEIALTIMLQHFPNKAPSWHIQQIIHNVLYSFFMLSPLLIPFIYVARNKVVQRRLLSSMSSRRLRASEVPMITNNRSVMTNNDSEL